MDDTQIQGLVIGGILIGCVIIGAILDTCKKYLVKI